MENTINEFEKNLNDENNKDFGEEQMKDLGKKLNAISEYGVDKFVDDIFRCPFSAKEIKEGNSMIIQALGYKKITSVENGEEKVYYNPPFSICNNMEFSLTKHNKVTDEELLFLTDEKWIRFAMQRIAYYYKVWFIEGKGFLSVVYDWDLDYSFQRIFFSEETTERFKNSIKKEYRNKGYGFYYNNCLWRAIVDVLINVKSEYEWLPNFSEKK